MPCKNYREALIETAATGGAPSRELRSHLDACASCRATFAEERQLFATIDADLHAAVNSEVSASLLPRVRARLNEQPAPRRFWIPAWTAVVVAAALVFAVVSVRYFKREPARSIPDGGSVASRVVPGDIPKATVLGAIEKTPPSARSHFVGLKRVSRNASVEEISVLLPAGRKEAVDSWVADLRRGTATADEMPAEKAGQPLGDLKISPLGVSPIEMTPLEDVSGNSASENKPTKD